MRYPFILTTIVVTCLGTTVALAQSQQAGNEASTNADATFQQLIDKCDNTDVLVLRARIRLAVGRLSDEAIVKDLTDQTNKGLSICGEDRIDEAKAELQKTLAAAEAMVTERFGQDETTEVKAAGVKPDDQPKGSAHGKQADDAAKDAKPWYQFW
ncbi:MAG: hypothetical protein AAFR90_00170 [Pseudomonadota bacterium]